MYRAGGPGDEGARMPATIHRHPEAVGDPPDIDFSDRGGKTIDELLQPEREWEERLKQWARDNGRGELRGEEVRWPVADGYARYVVYTEQPLSLIHIPTGDAWDIDEIMERGLNLDDIRQNVSRQRAMAELFGGAR